MSEYLLRAIIYNHGIYKINVEYTLRNQKN